MSERESSSYEVRLKREHIITIEQLNLAPRSTMDLLLVAVHEKPAAILTLPVKIGDRIQDKLEWEAERDHLMELLRSLSLPHVEEISQDDDFPEWMEAAIIVGKDRESLLSVLEARKKKDDFAIGIALGYPQSAAEAFAKGWKHSIIKDYQLPVEMRENPLLKFFTFRMSREYWQDELEVVRKYSEITKQLTPNLYNKILQEPSNLS